MRLCVLVTLLVAAGEMARVQGWMQQAFYPALFVILVVASLGVPIPEDIPLIAAGVLLRTHGATDTVSGVASWPGTLIVALVGIMVGDLVLYTLGRRWGADVVNHRSVRWIVTPDRFKRLSRRFLVHGTWFCFFGRFMMGIRAAMCLTAGATHFPYWRFFIADFCGALLSVPLFVCLGYWFAGMIPTLQAYVTGVQAVITIIGVIVMGVLLLAYRARKRRRMLRHASGDGGVGQPAAANCDVYAGGVRCDPEQKRNATSMESQVRPPA